MPHHWRACAIGQVRRLADSLNLDLRDPGGAFPLLLAEERIGCTDTKRVEPATAALSGGAGGDGTPVRVFKRLVDGAARDLNVEHAFGRSFDRSSEVAAAGEDSEGKSHEVECLS